MPGLSSLSADGASDSEGCHGGQARIPLPAGPCCWAACPLADVLLPRFPLLLPRAPGRPSRLPWDGIITPGCASKVQTHVLSLSPSCRPPALGWWAPVQFLPLPGWEASPLLMPALWLPTVIVWTSCQLSLCGGTPVRGPVPARLGSTQRVSRPFPPSPSPSASVLCRLHSAAVCNQRGLQHLSLPALEGILQTQQEPPPGPRPAPASWGCGRRPASPAGPWGGLLGPT